MRYTFSNDKIPRAAIINWLEKMFRTVEKNETENKIVYKRPNGDILLVYFKDLNILRVSKNHIWNEIEFGFRMDRFDTKLIIKSFSVVDLGLKNVLHGLIVPSSDIDIESENIKEQKRLKKIITSESNTLKLLKRINLFEDNNNINDLKSSLKELIQSPNLKNNKKEGKPLMKGKNVEMLQSTLQLLGYSFDKWGVDGIFGNETEQAVKNFQKDIGEEPTGIVDSNLVTKLTPKLSKVIKEKGIEVFDKVKKEKTEELPDDVKNVSVSHDDEYVIIKPDNYDGKNVHVLFGGAHTSGYSLGSHKPSVLKGYSSHMKPFARNVIIVITHHMNTLDRVKEYVKEKFDGGRVTSIAGFSQGGKETWKHRNNSSLSLVGLIDPSTYETDLSLGPNTYLYCWPGNWGKKGFVGQSRERLQWYCDNKDKYNGHVICKNSRHTYGGIMTDFYNEFGNKL